MKKLRLILFSSFSLFLLSLNLHSEESTDPQKKWTSYVNGNAKVVDGDTIVLMDRTRVRLHGIDAPERDQPYGPMATAALEHMVERSVYYLKTDTDRYGRMVATLYHSRGGSDIKEVDKN